MDIAQEFSIKFQILISEFLDYELVEEARKLKEIDGYLSVLLKKEEVFDFIEEIASGKTLLLGEGNFSFTCSLTREERISPSNLIATSFEKEKELSDEAIKNTKQLRELRVVVLYDIDATKLMAMFGAMCFDNIVFQFPHSGSREAIEGHNPNFILLRNFLKSAKNHLKRNGKVLVTAVDNPYYRGAFQFDEAAEEAGFQVPRMYKFDPSFFPTYTHTMTNQDESAIDNHKKFGTWIFRV